MVRIFCHPLHFPNRKHALNTVLGGSFSKKKPLPFRNLFEDLWAYCGVFSVFLSLLAHNYAYFEGHISQEIPLPLPLERVGERL